MIGYCCGKLALLDFAELSEVVEILDYLVTRENDETLLHAYQISYAALQNIPFDEFKRRVLEKEALQLTAKQTVKQIHNKVEHIIDDYTWGQV